MTEWKDVEHFPNYRVNDQGQIFSNRTNRELFGFLREGSRLYVHLRRLGKTHRVYVHDVVAAAFLEPRPSLDHWVEHEDGDIFNVAAENLVWTSAGPTKFRTKNRKLVIVETQQTFKNAADCAKFLNVNRASLSKHLAGKQKTIKGVHVVYV